MSRYICEYFVNHMVLTRVTYVLLDNSSIVYTLYMIYIYTE